MLRICSGLRVGFSAISKAATPLTCAVATEVPVVNCTPECGAGTRMSTPGAANATYSP